MAIILSRSVCRFLVVYSSFQSIQVPFPDIFMIVLFQISFNELTIMKTVAVPVLEGHTSIAVFPHTPQANKVNII